MGDYPGDYPGTTPGDNESWWDSAFNSIDSFWSSIGSFVNSSISSVISVLVSPLQSIGNALTGMTQGLQNGFNNVISNIQNIFNKIGEILENFTTLLSYLNPLDENFFLRIAFVPSEGYFQNHFNEMKYLIDGKFNFFNQVGDSLASLRNFTDSTWQGLEIDVPFSNQRAYIISPHFINEYGTKFKFWVSGIMYLFTSLFLIRRARELLSK